MTSFALLNNVDHQDLRIITERSARYGDDVMYAMTFPFEFRSVQAHYPILFHRDAGGSFYPVALFGFRERENLFLDASGWHAGYVPAMIRRQPFLIGFQDAKNASESGPGRVLSIDLDHPRVSRQDGEALFQPLGGRSPYLESAANLLEAIYGGYVHCKAFVAALQEHALIESVTFEIQLGDASRNQLVGFHTIDEEKLQGLSGDTLAAFSRQGFLLPLFMILASMSNIRSLIDLKNRRRQA